MKTTKRMRVSMLAVVALLVAGVFAVVACAPASVPEQPGSGSDVPESVSVPATETPFVLPQSGDGDGGQEPPTAEPTVEPTEAPTEEPTATRYVPPTADRSLCHVSQTSSDGTVLSTRCPPDGHPAVDYILRQRYNRAAKEIEALESRGETGDFPVVNIMVHTSTLEAVDDVVDLLEANGHRSFHADRSPGSLSVAAVGGMINIGLIPQLVEVEGVQSVKEVHDRIRTRRGIHEDDLPLSPSLGDRYARAVQGNEGRVRRGEAAVFPVIRVEVKTWGPGSVVRVMEFLKSNGGHVISSVEHEGVVGTRSTTGRVEADVSLGLVRDISQMGGVKRVEEIKSTDGAGPKSSVPSGDGRRTLVPDDLSVPIPAPAPEAVQMQADQWHRAGFTGVSHEIKQVGGGGHAVGGSLGGWSVRRGGLCAVVARAVWWRRGRLGKRVGAGD